MYSLTWALNHKGWGGDILTITVISLIEMKQKISLEIKLGTL
jgi:hypothetical protein